MEAAARDPILCNLNVGRAKAAASREVPCRKTYQFAKSVGLRL